MSVHANFCLHNLRHFCRRTPITDFTARVRFLNPEVRPGDINNDAKLQDFVTADHLQISLLDYFTDNTTASHRYYDIVEITVAARFVK